MSKNEIYYSHVCSNFYNKTFQSEVDNSLNKRNFLQVYSKIYLKNASLKNKSILKVVLELFQNILKDM